MSYRVVIVGAGPGGALLARELAANGVEVAIFEEGDFSSLGHDWSDAVEKAPLEKAGFQLPQLERGRWIGANVKEENETTTDRGLFEPHAIPWLKIYSPDGKTEKEIQFNLITTDRRRLGQRLVQQAEQKGASIFYRRRGVNLLYRETGEGLDKVEVYGVRVEEVDTGEVEEIYADVVVESCGFQAVLRSSLPYHTGLAYPFSEEDFALVQREVRIRDRTIAADDPIPDHYRYGYFAGYQWTHLHHQGKIDVGTGVSYNGDNPDPEKLIEKLISRHPSVTGEKLGGGRSLCIVGAPLTNFVARGFLVLGDAGSMSIPTTGCGTGSALMAGMWASQVLKEASEEKRNDLEKLWEFNRKFYLENNRGSNMAALAPTRGVMQSLGNGALNFLYRKDLLDQKTLENIINGFFENKGWEEQLRAAGRGFSRPSLLLILSQTMKLGQQIKEHYLDYPEYWSADNYSQWKREITRLLRRVRKLTYNG